MSTFEIDLAAPDQDVQRVAVDGAIEIGRELPSGVDGVTVADERVSRRHLQLSVSDGGLTVTDLGSTNGTSVNGTRISAPTVLHGGDRVTLGSVELTVVEVSAPAPQPPPAPPPQPPPAPAPPPPARPRRQPRPPSRRRRPPAEPAAGAGGRGARRADPTRGTSTRGTGARGTGTRARGPGGAAPAGARRARGPHHRRRGPAVPTRHRRARPRPTRWHATRGGPARPWPDSGPSPGAWCRRSAWSTRSPTRPTRR